MDLSISANIAARDLLSQESPIYPRSEITEQCAAPEWISQYHRERISSRTPSLLDNLLLPKSSAGELHDDFATSSPTFRRYLFIRARSISRMRDAFYGNFSRWLKPGLVVSRYPTQIQCGFIARIWPHWVHVFYYRYMLGSRNAGKPGYVP